jgi:hypothetical protein
MSSIEDRRRIYIDNNKECFDTNSLILKAYDNELMNPDLLNKCINDYIKNKEAKKDNDFGMLALIRILYLTKQNCHEQNQLLFNTLSNLLKEQQFWLSKNETSECFWSENHMICYLSSWHLWNQYNGIVVDHCDQLIRKFLDVKIKYFYYEFLSQVYNMYTLNALLNIYDYTNNIEFKNKSKQCIEIILQQFAEVITMNGTIFCASGRCYSRYKTSSLDKNCNKLLYLLTGICKERNISSAGAFFATSTFNPTSDYISNYHNKYERVYKISHCDDEFKQIYNNLSQVDRTIFQWSAGNYFNGENIDDTVKLINDYNLWGHAHFKLDPYETILKLIPKPIIVSTSNTFSDFSEGSPLCDIKYRIYNHNNYSLTSIENYNKGKLGAQQFPWVANVGGTPVFTQSGRISTIGNLPEAFGNSHLPYIKQQANVIMVMYNPSELMKNTTSKTKLDLKVYLNWNGFDNELKFVNKNWFFGEKITNGNKVFIAVYSTNGIKEEPNKFIYNDSYKQGWAAIVSDDSEYDNLTIFKNNILNNCSVTFKEVKSKNMFYSLLSINSYYYGKISFKNISFDMKW